MEKVEIDFWELLFLTETCIPPVPIARAYFWRRLIDNIYYKLSENEREKLFNFITDTNRTRFDIENNDCKLFYDRFNPENQFIVHYDFEGKEDRIDCFLHDGKYKTAGSSHIASKYIINIENKYQK